MDDRKLIGIVASTVCAVIAGLVVVAAQQYSDESPNLLVAGQVKYEKNRTLIPLRTRSALPVLTHGFRISLHDTPVEAREGGVIPETPSLKIASTSLVPNRWYHFDSPQFQVSRDMVLYFPVEIVGENYAEPFM
jgi:hypothetical protein